MTLAQSYKADRVMDRGVAVVRLVDSAHAIEVSIAPSVGNMAYEMKVHGHNILWTPAGIDELQKSPQLSGIPFLAPWANRLDPQVFWANGKKYPFDMELGNVRGATPIHGLLSASPLWKVTEVAADKNSAHVTSKIEFWKYPDLMKQWPFAHDYEMTYRLAGGMLEVNVTVSNLSAEPMPVAIGFHPYYRIPDVPRDEWAGHIPAKQHVVTDSRLIPTGEFRPMDVPDPFPLKGRTLDDGFIHLDRDAQQRAHFYIQSGSKKVEAIFGPKYQAAVVWEPNNPDGTPREFICFEPMAGITNAVNLNHAGKYPELQTVAPGAKWSESFWVLASGI
ncbi:MAG: aldose 1-epimerase [Bryobacterales bacterium]|nr:aldose 1-epimerase [Bryobacterales bacterium]